MIKKVRLLGRVRSDDQGQMIFTSKLHDGTPLSVVVTECDIQLNGTLDEKDNSTSAFLYVVQEAQQDHRCYLTLPKPSVRFGKSVTVHYSLLSSPYTKLENFHPRVLNREPEVEHKSEFKESASLFNKLFTKKFKPSNE
jgi:hypothetical protein